MRKALILAVFAVMVFLGGCAKKRYVIVTPEQARSKAETTRAIQAAKQADEATKRDEQQLKWKSDLGLDCPFGGQDQVWISPSMGRDIPHMKYGGLKSIFVRAVGVMRVKNPYTNMTIHITEGETYVVRDLCPGGSITLTKSMDPNLFRNARYRHVYWTGEGMVNGRLAFGVAEPMYLRAWQGLYEPRRDERPWLMRLDRVDRPF